MEFPFDISVPLRKSISIFCAADLPKSQTSLEKIFDIIDELGIASAQAQSLKSPVTCTMKLRQNPEQRIYIMREEVPDEDITVKDLEMRQSHLPRYENSLNLGQQSNRDISNAGRYVVVGILKVGPKNLFLMDEYARNIEIAPLCVLDFYIHEDFQRRGFGHRLFEFMLSIECASASLLAYDRPSTKLLSFLSRYYNLKEYLPQPNNFVVYKDFGLGMLALDSKGRPKPPLPKDLVAKKKVVRRQQPVRAEGLQTKFSHMAKTVDPSKNLPEEDRPLTHLFDKAPAVEEPVADNTMNGYVPLPPLNQPIGEEIEEEAQVNVMTEEPLEYVPELRKYSYIEPPKRYSKQFDRPSVVQNPNPYDRPPQLQSNPFDRPPQQLNPFDRPPLLQTSQSQNGQYASNERQSTTIPFQIPSPFDHRKQSMRKDPYMLRAAGKPSELNTPLPRTSLTSRPSVTSVLANSETGRPLIQREEKRPRSRQATITQARTELLKDEERRKLSTPLGYKVDSRNSTPLGRNHMKSPGFDDLFDFVDKPLTPIAREREGDRTEIEAASGPIDWTTPSIQSTRMATINGTKTMQMLEIAEAERKARIHDLMTASDSTSTTVPTFHQMIDSRGPYNKRTTLITSER